MTLPQNPDVIIIGAGTAGLSAAKALMEAGRTPLVLEAAGHVGGRCVTDTETFGAPFDRGGSWLHEAAINPLARIAEGKNRRLFKTEWDWRWVRMAGRDLSAAELTDYRGYEDVLWGAVNQVEEGRDISVAEAAPASPWRQGSLNWVAQICGGDADQVSALDNLRYQNGEGDWMVEGGLGGFVRDLHADVPVALETPVTRIDHSGPRVRVETPKGAAEAPHLILTVSAGVLAAEAIAFDPPLPTSKLRALDGLPMGLLNKVGMLFGPGWTAAHEGEMADYIRADGVFCNLTFGLFGSRLAVAFLAGSIADQIEAEGPGAADALCREALRAIFGSDAENQLMKTSETAWRGNPLTRGSYTYARPGEADARAALAEPWGRVHFAGEATIPEAYATVHGAWLSGKRAAEEVLAAMG